jgi:hypothetical protein
VGTTVIRGRIERHRVGLAAAGVIVAAVLAMIAYALAAVGYPVHHEDLNNGGVWTVSSRYGAYAQANPSLTQANGRISAASTGTNLDVVQDGNAVVGWDKTARTLTSLDASNMAPVAGNRTTLPQGAEVSMGGGIGNAVLAVLDPQAEALWAMRIDPASPVPSLAALVNPAPPTYTKVGAGAALTVGEDGTIYTISVTGRLSVIRVSGAGFAQPVVSTLDLGKNPPLPTITTVGEVPVVLAGDRLVAPNGTDVTLGDTNATLQQPGASADGVVLATESGLFQVDFGSGTRKPIVQKGISGSPARPAVLGGCVSAAWAATTNIYYHACPMDSPDANPGELPGNGSKVLVSRINWGQVIFNDPDSGATYAVQGHEAYQIVDWPALVPPTTQQNAKNQNQNLTGVALQSKPPKAVDDNFGARPGTATLLHPLDNDSDPAGNILAIDQVSRLDDKAAELAISPDAQTISIALPQGATNAVHFDYQIDDGKGKQASAHVTVTPGTGDGDRPPQLRAGYQARPWSVGASSVLDIPVLGDWRDPDGDPVTLVSAETGGKALPTTQDGDILYTAPPNPPGGPITISYKVTDGHGGTASGMLRVTVISAKATTGAKPVAEPDVARTVVGQPVTIYPLANDLPGADPTIADPQLALASAVPQQSGANVISDLQHGTVTITATTPQTYLLPYVVSYGSQTARGEIRVDVSPVNHAAAAIVAMPDTATLRVQQSAIVDVLANDYDPAGNVLVVQTAAPAKADSDLRVAVIGGHWLHISSDAVSPAAGPQQITYTVTNGQASATGSVIVTEQPASSTPDTPIAQTDAADVRAGDSVTVPVLDNDIDPDGATLSLVPGSAEVVSGGGQAFVSGNLVRYVAPADTAAGATAKLNYRVTNGQSSSGSSTATGTVIVTIHPAPANAAATDLPPAPLPLTYNVVAGGKLTITIPTSGIDPDGDTVTLTGVGVAPGGSAAGPHLGSIVSMTANSLTYQAFPYADDAGTDSFGYRMTDRFGKVGTGLIRIGVVAPGSLQPPVAIDDTVVGAPGAALAVDVVANDYVAAGDTVTVAVAGDASGATVEGKGGRILDVTAPAAGKTETIPYRLSDGTGDPSVGTLRVIGQKGWDNAPIARDDAAKASSPAATSAVVSVLANDSDPDASDRLRVSRVNAVGATTNGSTVTVPLTNSPQTIPYVITDGNKKAAAVIYVPALGSGAPYPKPGALIKIPAKGSSRPIDINDYLIDPAHKRLITTTVDTISTAPGDHVHVKATSGSTLTFTSDGYSGPGSITMKVTDGKSVSAPGTSGYVTIPLEVGNPAAVLTCPPGLNSPLQRGGPAVSVDVSRACHVWLPDGTGLDQVRFTAKWGKTLTGVKLSTSGVGGRVVTVTPDASAPGPQQGSVQVGIQGSAQPAQTLSYNVLPPQDKQSGPLMTLRPITIAGVKAGESRTVDVSQYAVSQLPHPQIRVLGCVRQSGSSASCKTSGGSVSVTPADSGHGVVTFALSVTDNPADKARTVHVLLSVSVLGQPAAPTAITADANRTDGGQVNVSWATPAYDGGASIDHYIVEWPGGSTPKCSSSPCVITGLTNGKPYVFRVAAHNAAGFTSAFSSPSNSATPDAKPDQVTGVSIAKVGDHALTIAWTPATGAGSAVTHYRVTIANKGGGSAPGAAVLGRVTTYQVTGLTNDDVYSFTVAAQNADGWGLPSAPVDGQSAGKPSPLTAPGVPAEQPTAPTDDTTVAITWKAETDPNGPPTKSYSVYRRTGDSGNGTQLCTRSANEELTCNDQVANDGTTYQYGVSATNGAGIESDVTDWTTFKAIGMPGQVADVQAFDGKGPGNTAPGIDGGIDVTFTVPKAHGAAITEMQYQLNGGAWTNFPESSWTEGTTTPRLPIGGLTNGTDYRVAVRAYNGTNFGPASAPSNTVTPYGLPHTPTGTATAAGTSVTYKWSDTENGRPLTYLVDIDGKATLTENQPGELDNQDRGYGYNYSISVKVTDSEGQSAQSTPQNGTTTNQLPAPSSVSCSLSGDTGVNCSWSWSADTTNLTNIVYHYQFANGGGSGTTSGKSASATGTTYSTSYAVTVYVTASSSHGGSSSSGSTTSNSVTTKPKPPDPQFQVQHSGTCNYAGYTACENVEVRLIGFAPGGRASCYAGGVSAPDWGPYTLSAGSDGTSGWVENGLFDSAGSRFTDGTFNLGVSANGLTCS